MSKQFTHEEVSKHNSAESCWVILYGDVYDVTSFLHQHPGGANAILLLAGRDATEEYDPVHPPEILQEQLKPEARLGTIDPKSKPVIPQRDEHTPSRADQQVSPQAEQNTALDINEKYFLPNVGTLVEKPRPIDLQSLLSLNDIESAAIPRLRRKAWAYYHSAGDDLISKSLNSAVYASILLRPRIFIDCTRCSTATTLLGRLPVSLPVYISPAAMARLAHPSGEHGIARAAGACGAMQLISNNASQTPEQIVANAPPGQVFGWQLYVQTDRRKSEEMLKRVAGLPQVRFVCLTLDAPVPGKREHDERAKSVGAGLPVVSATQVAGDHAGGVRDVERGKSVAEVMYAGTAADLTWEETLPWLAKQTDLPIVLKGVQTHEDAWLAARHAPSVKGIILSNHGGRALDTAPPAVHTLLEIRRYCPEVFDKVDVWVDGGIKRGTDVVKALCLGAKAVGIGRAPLYGLAVGGVDGVGRVLEILRTEMETCMRLLGVEKVEDLGLRHINTSVVERDIYNGPSGLDGFRPLEKLKALL